jgi:hypothetical protein
MRPPRTTIATLMAVVAAAAFLMYLLRSYGYRLLFGLLPVLPMLVGMGFRRLKPPGYRLTVQDGLMVGLANLAIVSAAMALLLAAMMGPVGATERLKAFLIVVAAGVAPLAVFLISTGILRLVSRDQGSQDAPPE